MQSKGLMLFYLAYFRYAGAFYSHYTVSTSSVVLEKGRKSIKFTCLSVRGSKEGVNRVSTMFPTQHLLHFIKERQLLKSSAGVTANRLPNKLAVGQQNEGHHEVTSSSTSLV